MEEQIVAIKLVLDEFYSQEDTVGNALQRRNEVIAKIAAIVTEK